MDGYDVNLVILVLLVIRLYCFVTCNVFSFVDSFVLYSLICASKSILFIDAEKVPKNPANSMRAALDCQFSCVCIAHVL